MAAVVESPKQRERKRVDAFTQRILIVSYSSGDEDKSSPPTMPRTYNALRYAINEGTLGHGWARLPVLHALALTIG
jgi:hypothetical protein